MKALYGKVAVVSGAGQEVGKGCALAVAKEGASVVLMGRSRGPLEATAAEIESFGGTVLVAPGDISVEEDVQRVVKAAVDRFGTIDVLVNSAHPGLNSNQQKLWPRNGECSIEETTDELFELHLSGLFGTFRMMRACFPYLRRNGGKVINFASASGTHGEPGWGAYGAAKEGIRGLTKVASRDWNKHRIQVNVIRPLAMSKERIERIADLKDLYTARRISRIGDPEADIGRVVVFLSTQDSDYITGHTFHVDGGGLLSP